MYIATQTRVQVQRDRLIVLEEVERITGLKKSSLYRLMGQGQFPGPVRVGPKSVRWPESHVLGWVQRKISESGPPVVQRAAAGAVGANGTTEPA